MRLSVSRSAPPRTPPHSSQLRELRPKARSSVSEQKGQVRVLDFAVSIVHAASLLLVLDHTPYHGPQDTIRHRPNG